MEYETEQTVVLKETFRQWNGLLEIKGSPVDDPLQTQLTRVFEFAIDRRNEEESLFTADQVIVQKLGIPLEEWTNTETEEVETAAGEEWINIDIEPKDPYQPKLGTYSEWYYSEHLGIYLSNKGRAYQSAKWYSILEPDIHLVQRPYYSYLKKIPQPGEIQKKFKLEPEEIITEPFQPLKGGSLERLDFLMIKLKSGQFIEETASE